MLVLAHVAVIFAITNFAAVKAQGDECSGLGIRPVIFFPGFLSSRLFDAADNFELEYDPVDPAILDVDAGGDALALPITWDGSALTQDQSSVGPEDSPGDAFPDLVSADGDLYVEPIFSDLFSIVRGWEASDAVSSLPNAQLLYTAAWDWRRDIWDESRRVLAVTRAVYDNTTCKPILVAHSFGGRLVHTGLARYGAELADMVHAILYAGVPFKPTSIVLPGTVTGLSAPGQNGSLSGPTGPEVFFTWPSPATLFPPLNRTCVNVAEDGGTQSCGAEDILTGISCVDSACGRPDSWPEGEPFFLPVDLQSAPDIFSLPLGLPLARALAGENATLTQDEGIHFQFVLETAKRMNEAVFDSGALVDIHPPATVMAQLLVSAEAGNETVPLVLPTYLECTGNSGTEGLPANVLCSDITVGGIKPSDGFLPGFTQFLPGEYSSVVQVFNYSEPSPAWIALRTQDPGTPFTPHAFALQRRSAPSDQFIDCGETEAPAAGSEPSLEALLCDLVARGDNAQRTGGDAPAQSGPGAVASPTDAGASASGSVGGLALLLLSCLAYLL